MYNTQTFFYYLNSKTNEPYLRNYECMKAAKAYLEDKLSEKNYFQEACTESDLTEVCYLIFEKSGGLSLQDKKLLRDSLEQKPSMDKIAIFSKELKDKIISQWCKCTQGTDPVTEVLRESIKNVLQYENFYIPVAAASYGYGLDDDIMFSLSVSNTLTEWPGELPSFQNMINAFEATKEAEIAEYVEQKIIDILKNIATAIRYQIEPKLDIDELFFDVSEYINHCFDERIRNLMTLTFNSNYEYKIFYYWLLSDMSFDALGIKHITCYYLHQALKSDTVTKAFEEARKPYNIIMLEHQQWFEEWSRNENQK